MKKFMTVLTALAVAAVVALPTQAAEKEKKEEKAKSQQFTGVVSAVDTEKNTVTVGKKNETKTFTCNADSKVRTVSKEAGTLADIKPGQKVQVEFATQGETTVCKKISILPPKEKKEKKEKAEEKKAEEK